MSSHSNIRHQILIPLTLTFLVLLCCFLLALFTIRNDGISNTLNREHGESIAVFKALLVSKTELMSAEANTIINDPKLKQAMRRKDRTALYSEAHPYLRKLSKNKITHLYFHDPTGKNFLRVHQPDQHSDLIIRGSLNQARETGTPSHGLELGPFGTLTLRLVIPWKSQAELLGYIELGTDVNDILSDLSIINNIDYLLVINKALLGENTAPIGYSWVNRHINWNQFPDKLIVSKSLDQIPPVLQHLLTSRDPNQIQDRSWHTAYLGSKHFAFKVFPFKENSGREIGNFILLHDMTLQARQFQHFIVLAVLGSSVLCLILFTFTWRILGQINQTIETTQQELSEEIRKTSQANDLLEAEIGERQKAEEALVELNANLESRINERTQHLEKATRDLEKGRIDLEQAYCELKSRQAMILHQDKMASIGLLAAGVAHDINNPIGFVTNNLEELQIYLSRLQTYIEAQQTELQSTASPESMKALHKKWNELGIDYILGDFGTLIAESLEGADRVGDIVKNLRSFSRIDDQEYKQANINECLESAIRITNHELRHKAVVHRKFGDIPTIHCQAQQLNQAFMNLLVNAAHALDKRGEVIVSTWSDTKNIYISIADTGCGIPDELQERIFEPFFTTKEINKGTGLGLSIVADIIQQHQGTISIQSHLNQGTTFTITLPIKAEVDDV
ncbi:MAG: ATP-binding protein [Trichlorobacter sp.]|uniref:ATP-binding protein n=1 Tax=Trichlorobacter sp. TaxID=2911007 RepID=UPI00256BC326|nr:ATP-binding protein [Trichlorobacter sp.]MDK9716969.1 ATP-binding protein [Trichlorobacter sp.]